MDALAFATLGFASDGTGTGTGTGTTAVVFADISVEGPIDVTALDQIVDATMLGAGDVQTIDIAAIAEVTEPGSASIVPDVEIDTCP